MQLVSTLLTGNNYSTWSHSMCIALSAKNKFGFGDGFVNKLSDKKAIEVALWQRCNDMVLMWILNSMSSGLSNSVVYAETAHVVWEDLKTRFLQDNGLWDELSSYGSHKNCSCGAMEDHNKKEEQNKVMQFLMGHDDSYAAVRGQILLVKPLPSVLKVFSMLQQLFAMMAGSLPYEAQTNAITGLTSHHSQEWIIDSGTTDHVTALPLSNSNLNKSLPPVKLMTGERVSISSIGNFTFDPKLSLTNVL
ncbi:uncharacterized protein LOC103927640 [Pyrus x bretschneideri]|uniref:uncharacterized protein LOC103927640 n=1 Tax=Pyrus x bretschneideri TaxID=225117 RepID=UPI002030C3FF|nr:uncharacterized protein LOC103927640 [Pyrus x bretschneideri]